MASTINADDGIVSGSAGVKTSADNSGVLELQSNGTTQFTLGSSSVVINEAGADVDFRVEGDTDSNLLFVDASTDRVGIGENAPAAKLHIKTTGNTTADGIRLTTGSEARVHNLYPNLTNGRDLLLAPYRSFQINTGSGTNEGDLILNGYSVVIFGTGASYTERMRLDASGNLGIGTTSIGARITLGDSSSADSSNLIRSYRGDGNSTYAVFGESSGGALLEHSGGGPVYFKTNNTERARITAGGYAKFSNTGTYNNAAGNYHELRTNVSSELTALMTNSGSSNPYGLKIEFSAASPNDTTRYFLSCDDSTALRAQIRSNGGLANYSANNVNLASDERLKKNIAPLDSTWGKVKGIEVVNFRYKDCNEGDPALYGVIAQQVQPIVPELVVVTREAKEAQDAVLDDEGNVVTPAVEASPEYYGIREQPMYWLAIKALQEAMTRIEELEAKVAALESK